MKHYDNNDMFEYMSSSTNNGNKEDPLQNAGNFYWQEPPPASVLQSWFPPHSRDHIRAAESESEPYTVFSSSEAAGHLTWTLKELKWHLP